MHKRPMSASQITLAIFACLAVALVVFTQWQVRRIEALYPPRGAFVEIAGGRMHLTQKNATGSARANVLLIHGASGSEADMMAPLGDALAERGFNVYAIDRPGQGYSDRLGGENPALQANLILEAMHKHGVESVIVVAHSLAGIAATNLALDHKAFVHGLVLVAPVTHPWPGGAISWYYKPAALPVIGAIFSNTLAMPAGLALLDRMLEAIFAPQTPPADYAQKTGAERVLRPTSFAANARDVAGSFAFVTRQAPRLKDITAPTAIVTGDADTIVLTHIHSYGSARDIPGATLRILPGVGHSPHWANPMAVVEAVEAVAARMTIAQPARP